VLPNPLLLLYLWLWPIARTNGQLAFLSSFCPAKGGDFQLPGDPHDKLQTEAGRRQLRDTLRDSVDVMVDHHAIGVDPLGTQSISISERIGSSR
jgi:hypothetical protein